MGCLAWCIIKGGEGSDAGGARNQMGTLQGAAAQHQRAGQPASKWRRRVGDELGGRRAAPRADIDERAFLGGGQRRGIGRGSVRTASNLQVSDRPVQDCSPGAVDAVIWERTL